MLRVVKGGGMNGEKGKTDIMNEKVQGLLSDFKLFVKQMSSVLPGLFGPESRASLITIPLYIYTTELFSIIIMT